MHQTVTVTLEIDVIITADEDRSDYGIVGVPVWSEAVNLRCEDEITANGLPFLLDAMPKDMRELVMEMAYEAAHDGDWTND